MAATLAHSPGKKAPAAASSPPTPPSTHLNFPRLASPSIQRNASTSSSRSTTTVSSTSSVQAAPMRPPPIETSTAATSRSQLPSRAQSESEGEAANGSAGNANTPGNRGGRYAGPNLGVGGRGGWGRNGPRTGAVSTSPTPGGQYMPPTILTSSPSPSPILNSSARTRQSGGLDGSGPTGTSPTTPRGQLSFAAQQDESTNPGLSPVPLRVTISLDPQDQLSHEHDPSSSFHSSHSYGNADHSPRSVAHAPSSPVRGRPGHLTTPSSPTAPTVSLGGKPRTLSVDGGPSWAAGRRSGSMDAAERERRQSQLSTASASSAVKKPSIRDYVLGEELGQGSYSTVYAATLATASSSTSPTSPRPPRRYAIKIINQHHLVQEKKVKYAMIERDALVRLSTPKPSAPSSTRGHRRGLSSSSSGGHAAPPSAAKRKSTASTNNAAGQPTSNTRKDTAKDRLSIATTDSGSSSSPVLTASSGSTQLSPVMGGKSIAGRRPSRSAEPPEMVPEQTETLAEAEALEVDTLSASVGTSASAGAMGRRSKPPSPVKEEPSPAETPSGRDSAVSPALPLSPPSIAAHLQQPPATPEVASSPMLAPGSADRTSRDSRDGVREARTPKKRRQSLAPSERSVKSSGGGGGGARGQPHQGVIRLHSTFNDSTSLYFVLDLASNGELLSFIRKFGSLDIISARYYAAQLIDTIEFMHDRGVVHRDLKPENILLDDDMRIKITDFGSAKLINKDEEQEDGEGKKRSFVGSADFVSPEVLRNEAASTASDIWAFGCILFQFLVGKPPFRGATDYLTFQKILKKEMEYPEGFDEEAKALVELILNLEPAQRPTAAAIKLHPFFAPIDFATIWTVPAPEISTGLRPPAATLASLDPASDIWGVFDDEASDGGFDYDRDDDDLPEGATGSGAVEGADADADADERAREREPRFDRQAAAHAVRYVDHPNSAQIVYTPADAYPQVDLSEELDPPRPAYAMGGSEGRASGAEKRRKSRGWSHGSSSSGGNRSALTGWLEAMRIGGGGAGSAQSGASGVSGTGAGHGVRSNRTSRTSVRSDEYRVMLGSGAQGQGQASGHARGSMEMRLRTSSGVPGGDKWSSLLLANESIIFTSPILVRTSSPSLHLPSFLLPASKRRQLILTDFPRMIIVKDDHPTSTVAASTTPAPGAPGGAGGSVSSRGGTPEPGALPAHPSPLAQAIQPCESSPSPSPSPAPSSLRVKGECIFVVRPSGATGQSGMSGSTLGAAAGAAGVGVPNRVLEVQEKGSKGFSVQTPSTTYWYTADSAELRDRWMAAIRRISL
ncbi:hypothetical protein IAT38_007645 [Cryptococcus sp. DSM 104549]